jgi:hypothetical protein
MKAKILKAIVRGEKGNDVLKAISLFTGENEIWRFQIPSLIREVSVHIKEKYGDIFSLEDNDKLSVKKIKTHIPRNPEKDFDELELGISFSVFKNIAPPAFSRPAKK